MYICITEPLCCTPETNTTLQINYISIKMFKNRNLLALRKSKRWHYPEYFNRFIYNFYKIQLLKLVCWNIMTWITVSAFTLKIHIQGLPWWRSGWESACRCRGHGFEPWSGKIPHAAEQLVPWATTTEPARLEPVLRNKKPRQWEAHAPRWRVAPAYHNWRKPTHRNEDPTQP